MTTPPISPSSAADTGRRASYRLVSYEVVETPKPSKGSYQARIVLSDGHPSPVAWLSFWDEADFNPEEHWNREADLERCPKCHPQYELHFQMKELPAILKTLQRLGGKAKLSYQNDHWKIDE
ncbi:MAG: hypothetical protein ACOYMN_01095 [Roseimicrobium sp.]